ncbi:MAG: dependent oxidoreductase [Myxococcaceae bacterium]|nr:dependent oxidoreductase [Myxococcaceae bacterium]
MSSASRQRALKALADESFDIVVVGGGITGCGIARDAALRGLKVGLIEKLDFAAGTSSKSSKLVHGGLRYLEQAEFKLVFESVSERKLLMSRARHLVRPQSFLVTRFKGDRRWLVTLDLGLWIYDALCLFGSYRNHRTFGATRTLQHEPELKKEGLSGGILYYDCVTDDARLTLENAIDAQALGAVVLNHVRAGALLKDPTGRIVGVTAHDENPEGERAAIEVRAKLVINATGPWSDEVRALVGEKPILTPTKGTHVVLDAKRLPVRHALMMLGPRDGRAVFAIPWGLGRTVIGTTDTFFSGNPDEVNADRADAEYLLEIGNHYFPNARLTLDDVLATWSGLRPLLKPEDEGVGASQVSREHMMFERPGFLTIAGGKLTTYRRIAFEVVDRAMEQLGQQKPSTTQDRFLPGSVGLESDEQLAALAGPLEAEGIPPAAAQHLANTFGTRSAAVAARVKADPSCAEPLDPELPYLTAQIDEAIENEFALTLDDVLTRRIPLVLRARDQGLAIAPRVAARLQRKLGWSDAQTQAELAHYRSVVEASRKFREG